MRPTLAIIPLALLLAWFGPSPSGEAEASAAEQFAQAWASIQRGVLLQATAEVTPRR